MPRTTIEIDLTHISRHNMLKLEQIAHRWSSEENATFTWADVARSLATTALTTHLAYYNEFGECIDPLRPMQHVSRS